MKGKEIRRRLRRANSYAKRLSTYAEANTERDRRNRRSQLACLKPAEPGLSCRRPIERGRRNRLAEKQNWIPGQRPSRTNRRERGLVRPSPRSGASIGELHRLVLSPDKGELPRPAERGKPVPRRPGRPHAPESAANRRCRFRSENSSARITCGGAGAALDTLLGLAGKRSGP
jgi:hypothetical protein